MPQTPFVYPKSRHRRRHQPPVYVSYASYKPFLKQEFASQCVYCRLPDGLKGEDNFGVDHYRPRSRFPELAATYANLFYACNGCNRRKGAFWPTDMQWRARQFVPNPCDHVMFDHLRYRAARVEPKSPAGQLTESMLMLNDRDSVEYREFVLAVIVALEQQQRQIRQTLNKIDQRLASHPEQTESLLEGKASFEQELARLEQHLRRIGGVP